MLIWYRLTLNLTSTRINLILTEIKSNLDLPSELLEEDDCPSLGGRTSGCGSGTSTISTKNTNRQKKENQNTPCREINMQMKTIKVFQNYKLWYSPRNETTQRITEIVINTICSWKSKYKFEINHNENLYW